jgi:hypothetical protein
LKAILLVLLVAITTGCSVLHPVPIALPDAPDAAGVYKSYSRWQGPPPEKTLAGIRRQIAAYNGHWLREGASKRGVDYWADEATFVGAITVAAAGVRKSTEGGLIGAILAAGGTLFSAHYGLEVQAVNYEKAAHAMQCLQNALAEVSDQTADIFFDANGSFKYATNSHGLQKISQVPHQANGAIQRIVDKLRTAQALVKLSTPEPAAVTTAYENLHKARQAGGGGGAAVLGAAGLAGAAALPNATISEVERLGTLSEQFDVCVSLL